MFPYIELTEESELLSESPYEGVEDVEIKNIIKEALFNLREKEKKVLEMRFGLIDGIEKTLEEVGAEFGVTKVGILRKEMYRWE